MLFQIIGAHKDNGQDIQIRIEAKDVAEAHQIANQRGILVSSCTPMAARPAKPPAPVTAGVSRTASSDAGEDDIPLADERPAPVDGGTKDCPRCGESIKAKAKVCRFCGHAFDGSIQQPTARIISQTEVEASKPVDPKKLAKANSSCLVFFGGFIASFGVLAMRLALTLSGANFELFDRGGGVRIMPAINIGLEVAVFVMGAFSLIYVASHMSVLMKVVLWKRVLGFIGGIGLSLEFIGLLIALIASIAG